MRALTAWPFFLPGSNIHLETPATQPGLMRWARAFNYVRIPDMAFFGVANEADFDRAGDPTTAHSERMLGLGHKPWYGLLVDVGHIEALHTAGQGRIARESLLCRAPLRSQLARAWAW